MNEPSGTGGGPERLPVARRPPFGASPRAGGPDASWLGGRRKPGFAVSLARGFRPLPRMFLNLLVPLGAFLLPLAVVLVPSGDVRGHAGAAGLVEGRPMAAITR